MMPWGANARAKRGSIHGLDLRVISAPCDGAHTQALHFWEKPLTRFLPIALVLASIQTAEAFSLTTWNVAEGSIENVTRRETDIQRLGVIIRAKLQGNLPDVLVLQEGRFACG